MGAVAAITEPRTARFGAMVRIREQGQDQGAEGHAGLRLERKKNHLWAASALAVVKAVRCVSNRTRPVSWLGPATSGVHPHTKGARCFAGGHRHGLPSAQGASSRLARRQAVGKPLMAEARHTDQGNGGGRDSGAMTFSPRRPVVGRQGAHTVAEGDARWGVPPPAGRLPRRQESGRRGRGMRRRQVALGTARRLRGASRLLAEDSSGSVPVQSG